MAVQPNEWRGPLIESLRDSDATRKSFDDRLTRDVLLFIGFVIVVLGPLLTIFYALLEAQDLNLLVVGYLVFVLALVLGTATYGMRLVGRMRSGSARDLLLVDARRPVLYLRSFDFELAMQKGLSVEGPEESLVQRLSRIGPVVAIGRPDERLPPIGAGRFYPTHAQWQSKVSEICAAAQYVFWVTGTSPGLTWELSHILNHVPLERVVIVAHPHLLRVSDSQRATAWQRFQDALGALFPSRLPAELGWAHLFHFASGSGPVRSISVARPIWPIARRERQLHDALDQLFVEKGLLSPGRLALSRWLRRLFGWTILAALGLGAFGIMMGSEALIAIALSLFLIGIFASLPLLARNPPIAAPADRKSVSWTVR